MAFLNKLGAASVTEDDIAKHWEIAEEAVKEYPLPSAREMLVFEAQLEQESCRSADRRLVTKRTHPDDEKPITEDEVREMQQRYAAQFIPTSLQKSILDALDGRALKKQPLADEACGGEGSRLYKPGGIKELMALGLVATKRGVGYYRPDAPPPGAIDVNGKGSRS